MDIKSNMEEKPKFINIEIDCPSNQYHKQIITLHYYVNDIMVKLIDRISKKISENDIYDVKFTVGNNCFIDCACLIKDYTNQKIVALIEPTRYHCKPNSKKVKCINCNILMVDRCSAFIPKRHVDYYCQNCMPPIVLYFKTNLKDKPMVEIQIPEKNNMGMPETWFYDQLADKLGINVDRIILWNKTKAAILSHEKETGKKSMMCPSDCSTKESCIFPVYIMDLNR